MKLKLYYNSISPNSRRVEVALLEKTLEFEPVEIELNGEQNRPDLLAINPLHHIPVLEDDGFRVVESLAILDYLEAKYPTPALLPTDAKRLATVRMVELVTVNELLPAAIALAAHACAIALLPVMLDLPGDSTKIEQAKQKVSTVLAFFEQLLGEQNYFADEHLTLAEVVAGTVVPSLPLMGISLSNYPKLNAWTERLNQRPAWIKTIPSQEAMAAFTSRMKTRFQTANS